MRGTFAGILIGALVSLVVAAGLSVLMGRPGQTLAPPEVANAPDAVPLDTDEGVPPDAPAAEGNVPEPTETVALDAPEPQEQADVTTDAAPAVDATASAETTQPAVQAAPAGTDLPNVQDVAVAVPTGPAITTTTLPPAPSAEVLPSPDTTPPEALPTPAPAQVATESPVAPILAGLLPPVAPQVGRQDVPPNTDQVQSAALQPPTAEATDPTAVPPARVTLQTQPQQSTQQPLAMAPGDELEPALAAPQAVVLRDVAVLAPVGAPEMSPVAPETSPVTSVVLVPNLAQTAPDLAIAPTEGDAPVLSTPQAIVLRDVAVLAPAGAPDTSPVSPAALTPDFAETAPDPERVAPVADQTQVAQLRVRTNRLPTVQIASSSRLPGSTGGALPVSDGDGVSERVEAADRNSDVPLVRYGATVDVPADIAKLAVVLIDDGTGSVPVDVLRELPIPISFALDSTDPMAPVGMRAHRDRGDEVLAMVNLPPGFTAQDTEVAMQQYLAALPEAVAVLDGIGTGTQQDRDASAQMRDILLDTGHGLVLQPSGLNTSQKLALRAGLPAATVFRDIDGAGQSGASIRRSLDNAAFRARQDGAVVVMGRLRPETVTALVEWGLQNSTGQVALVPVSAVLRSLAQGV